MHIIRRTFAALAAACLVTAVAFAADPSGTWKWTSQSRSGGGGSARENTLTLVAKDGKLSGKVAAPGRGGDVTTSEIKDASIKGDTVTFTVERQYGDNKVVQKYTGTLAGDTITGTREGPGRDGQSSKQEWVAKRAK